MSSVGLIILAAGGSTRLGTPKQLLKFEGKSLLRRTVETALASNCRPVVVVVGSKPETMRQQLSDLPVIVVENSKWERGMGSSILAGVDAISRLPDLSAVLLMLCDQPLLSPTLLNDLVQAHLAEESRLVASAYGGILGTPALFPRSFFPDLLTLNSSGGAKSILRRHSENVVQIPFDEGLVDIDTMDDYRQLTDSRV